MEIGLDCTVEERPFRDVPERFCKGCHGTGHLQGRGKRS